MDGVEADCVTSKAIEKDEGFVTMHINGKPTELKVDTGAKCNVMLLDTFKRLNSGKKTDKAEKCSQPCCLWRH